MPLFLYESSAGSGKTYTLVQAYLTYILKRPEKFRHVLAVTFTNKAAGEMKERIIRALKALSRDENATLKESLLKETGLSAERLQNNARRALRLILHGYSDFAVMTIDSFIYKVVRSFAVELGLPLLFDVDLDESRLVSLMADEFIDSLKPGEVQAEMLVDYIIDRIDLRNSWKYDKELILVARELLKERAVDKLEALAGTPPDTFKKWLDVFKKKAEMYRCNINKKAKDILNTLERAGLQADDFSYKAMGIHNSFRKLSLGNKPDDFDLEQNYSRFVERQWFPKDINVKKPDVLRKFSETDVEKMADELQEEIEKGFTDYVTAYAILNTLPLVALLSEIEKRLERYKKENNLIPISDFGKKVAEVVKTEPVPFIYWKVGEKFDHYLIDEFQDTSRIQWSNLFPLVENSMAGGWDNLCVGDPKQSIYRWRGGDPEIIRELPVIFGPTGGVKTERLKGNWRSAPEIVSFNNRFFSFDPQKAPLADFKVPSFYSPGHVEQEPQKTMSGYVSVCALPDEHDFRERALDRVLENIHRLQARMIPLSDMTVLVRTNREGARAADYFFRKGIDVLSPDSLMLNNDRRVRFLVSLFNYLESGEELFFREMEIFLSDKGEPLEQSLKERIASLQKRLRPLSLYEKAEACIQEFGLHIDGGSFMTGFLEAVYSFSQALGEAEGLTAFLEWWEENKESEKCALKSIHGRNALQVMTIHKAKGLEFPVVFIPFADWEMVGFSTGFRQNTLWVEDTESRLPLPVSFHKYLQKSAFEQEFEEEVQKNYEDNLNILYVAFTRASRALYIVFPMKEGKKDETTAGKIHTFIRERLGHLYADNLKPLPGGGLSLELGREPQGDNRGREQEESRASFGFASAPWQERLHIKRASSEEWALLREEDRAVKRGLAVHRCFEKAKNEDDIQRELSLLFEKGVLNEKEYDEFKSGLEKIMGLSAGEGKVRDFFSGNYPSLNEAVLLTGSGDYRPDRLLFTPRGVVVIDYKTGAPREEDRRQVRTYRTLLEEAGYQAGEGYLLYLSKGTIERVV